MAAFPHADERTQRDILRWVRRLEEFRLTPAPSVYDQVDEPTRLWLIGSAYAFGGEAWLAAHPRQAAWLREHGIDPKDCAQRYRDWLKKELEDPRWRPAAANRKARPPAK